MKLLLLSGLLTVTVISILAKKTAPSLYIDPQSPATTQEAAWQSSNPAGAAAMAKIAAEPHADWFGNWNTNVGTDVTKFVDAAAAAHAVPVLVAYNVPQRDCGGYSAGGTTPQAYRDWIGELAGSIAARPAIVIVEPDALAQISCLSSADQATRLSLLKSAITTLKNNLHTKVYIDAGHANWIPAADMAERLKQAGVGQADGFSLNVSNFTTTADNLTYGQQISQLTGGKHFVIDTSRNGLGSTPDNQWCNPPGRALGDRPTLTTGHALADAYLWIKYPGESDGSCNSGPPAGQWWPDYALGLAQRAAY